MLPDGMELIEANAFYNCTALKKIEFQGTVKKMKGNAFGSCTSLESFDVPEGIEYMDSILDGCEQLTKITLSSTVRGFCFGEEELDTEPFYGVNALQQIEVSSGNSYLKTDGTALYTADGKILLYHCVGAEQESYDVQQGTEVIGEGAFKEPMLFCVEQIRREVVYRSQPLERMFWNIPIRHWHPETPDIIGSKLYLRRQRIQKHRWLQIRAKYICPENRTHLR